MCIIDFCVFCGDQYVVVYGQFQIVGDGYVVQVINDGFGKIVENLKNFCYGIKEVVVVGLFL